MSSMLWPCISDKQFSPLVHRLLPNIVHGEKKKKIGGGQCFEFLNKNKFIFSKVGFYSEFTIFLHFILKISSIGAPG